MHIPFDQLKNDSRIWIFQANRVLIPQEAAYIDNILRAFTSNWAAHGNPLASSYSIVNNLHLIIGVDMDVNQASGCSIDALIHGIRQIGEKFDIDFFDRRAVSIEKDGIIGVVPFSELGKYIEQGWINEETTVFNNLVATKGLLQSEWKIRAKDSWIKRYFSKTSITT